MIGRRQWMGGAVALGGFGLDVAQARAADGFAGLPATLARIEKNAGGRLGVAVLDTGNGRKTGHRQSERFAMCSTFKLLAAAGVLARADAGQLRMDQRIRVTQADLVAYSPVAEKHVGGEGMTLAAMCEAIVTLSDNGAANLLLRDALGGPPGLTTWLRRIGDPITRLDRIEPALNESAPGDLRDTTTPAAMLADIQALCLGELLSPGSRAQLVGWLRGNLTGDKRLRAGLPPGWQAGEKTGTWNARGKGSSSDVGLLWPPGGAAPVLVAAYLADSPADGATRDAALAEVARAIAAAWVL